MLVDDDETLDTGYPQILPAASHTCIRLPMMCHVTRDTHKSYSQVIPASTPQSCNDEILDKGYPQILLASHTRKTRNDETFDKGSPQVLLASPTRKA